MKELRFPSSFLHPLPSAPSAVPSFLVQNPGCSFTVGCICSTILVDPMSEMGLPNQAIDDKDAM
jgi:hypothetical protein